MVLEGSPSFRFAFCDITPLLRALTMKVLFRLVVIAPDTNSLRQELFFFHLPTKAAGASDLGEQSRSRVRNQSGAVICEM